MNRVILIGRIGKDAEMRRFENTAKAVFTLATSEKYKDRNGTQQERTEWHSVEIWGDRAEKLAPHLAKGKLVMVEGRIRYEEYEKDGVKRKYTTIACSTVELLASAKTEGQQQQSVQVPQQQQQVQQTAQQGTFQHPEFNQYMDEDGLPF